jgi:disulfide bond formation protein DsbB
MTRLALDRVKWPLLALVASLAMLATAHAFERFLHLAPCPLCYTQRQVYWAAAGIAGLGVLWTWRGARPRTLFAFCVILGLVFLTSAGVSGYHALVEWKVLPAPETCAVQAGSVAAGDLWEQLNRPQAVVSCADAAWRLLGLSMAGWNFLVSVGLACLSFFSAARPVRVDTANEIAPSELAPRP